MTQPPDPDPRSGDGPSLQKGQGGGPQDGYGNPFPGPAGPQYGDSRYGAPQYPPPGQPQGGYPQGGGYPPPGYPQGPGAKPRNGLGIAALVLGILAIPAGLLAAFVGTIIGIVAIVLGAVTLGRVRKRTATNKGMAIAGIITGLIGAIIGIVLTVVAVRIAADCLDELGSGATQAQLESCANDKIVG